MGYLTKAEYLAYVELDKMEEIVEIIDKTIAEAGTMQDYEEYATDYYAIGFEEIARLFGRLEQVRRESGKPLCPMSEISAQELEELNQALVNSLVSELADKYGGSPDDYIVKRIGS